MMKNKIISLPFPLRTFCILYLYLRCLCFYLPLLPLPLFCGAFCPLRYLHLSFTLRFLFYRTCHRIAVILPPHTHYVYYTFYVWVHTTTTTCTPAHALPATPHTTHTIRCLPATTACLDHTCILHCRFPHFARWFACHAVAATHTQPLPPPACHRALRAYAVCLPSYHRTRRARLHTRTRTHARLHAHLHCVYTHGSTPHLHLPACLPACLHCIRTRAHAVLPALHTTTFYHFTALPAFLPAFTRDLVYTHVTGFGLPYRHRHARTHLPHTALPAFALRISHACTALHHAPAV